MHYHAMASNYLAQLVKLGGKLSTDRTGIAVLQQKAKGYNMYYIETKEKARTSTGDAIGGHLIRSSRDEHGRQTSMQYLNTAGRWVPFV